MTLQGVTFRHANVLLMVHLGVAAACSQPEPTPVIVPTLLPTSEPIDAVRLVPAPASMVRPTATPIPIFATVPTPTPASVRRLSRDPRNMADPRARHTSTRLLDGRVLVAGGNSEPRGVGSLASAEIYDPATDIWSSTASMTSDRDAHTATLLQDGRVLVAGGRSLDTEQEAMSLVEAYDPSLGTWSPVNQMIAARAFHTATRLLDGRVLVVGGGSGDLPVPLSAELYEPSSSTWSSAGEMSEPRLGHTATLLGDGTVLVVGRGAGGRDAPEEIYDPATGKWFVTAKGGR